MRGNHRSSGVCTRRQSENWCWPENDAMYDCGTTAITLCRKPPNIVAMPVGKQHWGKHRVQCRRLSDTAACQDTLLYEGTKRQVMQHRSKHMCCRLSDAVAVPKDTQHMYRSNHGWCRLSIAVAMPKDTHHRSNQGCTRLCRCEHRAQGPQPGCREWLCVGCT